MHNNPYKKKEIIKQAIQFHLRGNIQEAIKYYQFCISKEFNDHTVFSNYGAILQSLDKLKEAEKCYRKAIELNPNFANAHSNLGNILRDLKKLQDAEFFTRRAIELDPNFADAHSNLGNILRDLGKLQDAEFFTRKAIELDPNHAMAHSNLGNILRDLGKLQDAEFFTRKAIELDPNHAMSYSNLGSLLKDLGKLQDAEFFIRKAIELDPNHALAHYNLGAIMIMLGKLQDAEFFTRKAIELDPNHAIAYFSLSSLQCPEEIKKWRLRLFSPNILNNQFEKDKVYIYFARANILHKEKNYEESSKYLLLANHLKYKLYSSNFENLTNKSKQLLFESSQKGSQQRVLKNFPESIFIVGMPRSGSTLLESILSMNNNVDDLGEINILEESFLSWKKSSKKLNLAELYLNKVNFHSNESRITTNKSLYNYLYTGIIAEHIPNAKIIHSYRNPLDNILSIYRANFSTGNEYSSSLVDCAKVYLDQEEVMTKYKKRFKTNIYDLNYESLVNNPNEAIKSLISWLGWKWDDSFLSPHLNPRSVSTASNIQVRSPINSKSIGGWKNYKNMLKPAMEIITQNNKYQDLKY